MDKRVVGRNEPCPCGSGKKFKKCCEAKKGVTFTAAVPSASVLVMDKLSRRIFKKEGEDEVR